MKKSSKRISLALTVAALLFTLHTQAQTTQAGTFKFILMAEGGLPTGTAHLGSTFSLGGNLRLQYGISNQVAVTLATGGDHFFSKKSPITGQRYASFGDGPVKAGVKWFFVPHIYASGEIGTGVEVTSAGLGNARFLLAPSAGYANDHWDFSLMYENLSIRGQPAYGLFDIRAAYGFKL